jgi:uncharacterized protein (TIGR00725 family)
MARRLVVGVMGAGLDARPSDVVLAERLGELVAEQGWVLLSGGRDAGVMAAANRGAKRVPGSITVGVLPSNGSSKDDDVSPDVDIALFTGMGDGRNVINVLSSEVVIACGAGGPGTTSEAALALKASRPLVLLAPTPEAEAFFRSLGSTHVAHTAEETISIVRHLTGL